MRCEHGRRRPPVREQLLELAKFFRRHRPCSLMVRTCGSMPVTPEPVQPPSAHSDVKAVVSTMSNVPGSYQFLAGVPRSHSAGNTSGNHGNLSISAATRTRGWVAAPMASWMALDWVLAAYVTYVALVAVVWAVPRWPYILGGHAALVVGLLLLPPRGAAWEQPRLADSRWLSRARSVARFLRYTYPALLLTPFFEEVSLTVNAAAANAPYWFEHYLFSVDRSLFGGPPAVMLSQAGNPVLDEIMHAFYFSYYPLIIGGIVIAWNGDRPSRGEPGRAFHTAMACMMLGFFLSYVWYPFLPARGPWEHPEVVAGLRPFGGWVFTRAIDLIMAGAAVSGGCFPSAHVSGAWALTFGLYATDRRVAFWFGLVAAGLSVACVYTRYHYAIDVLAGLTVAAVTSMIGFGLTRHLMPPTRQSPSSTSGAPWRDRVPEACMERKAR